MGKRSIYAAWWVLWALTANSGFILSLWLQGEPPFWPHFSSQATADGAFVWAAFAGWVYLLPVVLLVTRKWWLSEREVSNASNH